MMSRKSISRLIVTIQATKVHFASMLTLTYPDPYPEFGRIVKSDLDYIIKHLKRHYTKEYLWFLEFQRRGAPHIHILLETDCILPKDRVDVGLKWVARTTCSNWFSQWIMDELEKYEEREGYEQIANRLTAETTWKMAAVATHYDQWTLIRDRQGAKKYVTKYAAKQYQKEVPKAYQDVGRFWGCSRGVKPEMIEEYCITDDQVRKWLDSQGHPANAWEILPKYLFGLENGPDIVGEGIGENGHNTLRG